MRDLVIAVDLGGTQLRFALYGPQYQVLARRAEPTHAHEGVESVLERLIEGVRGLGEAEPASWDRVRAVGVSAPGPLDPRRGVIRWAPNLPGWRDVPLADRLSEAVGLPVFLGNDGNLAALAEQRCGAGQGQADLVYITVSTGIGGGVVSDGQLILGRGGLGGEVGHMTLEPNGPRCNCGNVGCLEALASGTAIARQARELVAAGVQTRIADLASGDLERITAKLIHEAARQGDVIAIDLFRKAGMYLGIGIVNLMYLFNPGMVVIGGGVSKAGDLLFVPMQATIRQRIHEIYWQDCPVVRAALGDDVCLMGAAILAMEGAREEMMASFVDVTERKQAEEEIRKLLHAIEQSPSTVVITDIQGSIEYVNPKFTQVTGYTSQEVLGKNPRLLKPGDQPPDFYKALWETILAGKEWRGEFANRKKNGELYWELASISPVRNADGIVTRFIKVGEDITVRKEAEEALKWEVEVNSALAELSGTLLRPASLEDISYSVLQHAKRLTGSQFGYVGYIDPETGYLVSSTLTRDIWDICQVEGKDVVFSKFGGLWGWVLDHRQPLLTNNPTEDPRSSGTPAGHIPVHRFLSVPAVIGEKLVGQVALANAPNDYTERDLMLVERLATLYALVLQRHWTEATLRQRTEELQARNEELDAFAHTVAHDLKNPLGLVLGFAELLEDPHPSMTAKELQTALHGVTRNARRMSNIVDELLLLASVRQAEVRVEPLDMGSIVAEACQRLSDMTAKSQAQVVLPATWPVALGHAPWVEEVWVNYISNAIKYGGQPPRMELGATVQQDGMVCFWIWDNGPGLTLEEQTRLFTPFTKLSQIRATGHGLGLSIVRRIVSKLGGQVGVESEGVPGRGSRFYFTLPGVVGKE